MAFQTALGFKGKLAGWTFHCLAFVNTLDVIFQGTFHSKTFAAGFTLEVFTVLMNKFNVPSQRWFHSKRLRAELTFEISQIFMVDSIVVQ